MSAVTRRAWLWSGALGLFIAACGGTAATIDPAPSPDGAGSGAGSETDPGDAGADAEAITGGGSNIDPDAGAEGDAGAPCNAIVNDSPAVTSKCTSLAPTLLGGALVAGKYRLAAVNALGQPKFCQQNFVPVTFKQTMDLTVDGDGVGTANLVVEVAGAPPRTRTTTLDPAGKQGSPLEATATCPPSPAAKVAYFSGPRAGTQSIILRLEYGAGQGLYRFDKQ